MKRILGLDIGDSTIGVAVSDLLGMTAQPVKTIIRIGRKKDLEALGEIIAQYEVSDIVVGLPKNMNNTLGPQAEKVLEFSKKIENKFKVKIIFIDERLTTVSAERLLIESDMRRDKRKGVIDTVAATYILQSFLDGCKKEEV